MFFTGDHPVGLVVLGGNDDRLVVTDFVYPG